MQQHLEHEQQQWLHERRLPGHGPERRGLDLAQPLYQLWSQSFLHKEPDAQINYQPIGSGGGIEQFTAETVDFGATDVPLQSDEIGNLPNQNYIEFPTALGAVVFAYNVQGVDTPLKLDGKTISDIFLGNVTKWNDAKITSQNPGVNLPDESTQVVHRSDESGTTAVSTGGSRPRVPSGHPRSARTKPCNGRSARARAATTALRRASRRPTVARGTSPTTSR